MTKENLNTKIFIVGVGGAGNNAINHMIKSGVDVPCVACNTDAQVLEESLAQHKIQLGTKLTQGKGAGSDPEVGRLAMEESIDDVKDIIRDADMVCITAGMGGGTGTLGAAVLAKAAKELGILTVGIVTLPFAMEGARRAKMAEIGISHMIGCVDTLVEIHNQSLFRMSNENTFLLKAFEMVDDVLCLAIKSCVDLIVKPGLVNLDFADICSVMKDRPGKAMLGTGCSSGERRARQAAELAVLCPLLGSASLATCQAMIIHISGKNIKLFEVDEAVNYIREQSDPQAHIIVGVTIDDSLQATNKAKKDSDDDSETDDEECISVSVIATGICQEDLSNSDDGDVKASETPESSESSGYSSNYETGSSQMKRVKEDQFGYTTFDNTKFGKQDKAGSWLSSIFKKSKKDDDVKIVSSKKGKIDESSIPSYLRQNKDGKS